MLLASVISVSAARPEVIVDLVLNSDFVSQVKSIDEFICRFNGSEINSEIVCDTLSRQSNICALFNYEIDRGDMTEAEFRKMVHDFADTAVECGVELKVTGSGMLAEANGSFSYGGENYPVTLVLQSEEMENGSERWAIAGIRGLTAAGVIDTADYRAINPLEHELNFMTLDMTILSNSSKAFGYRSQNRPIDELSVFLAMIKTGNIKPGIIRDFTLHFIDVPGFIFTVTRFPRRGANSGWLISALKRANDTEKQQYINQLLNL